MKCRYIAAEQLPVKYGGLSKDGEFGTTDAVIETTVRPAAKHTVEFPVTEVNFSISLMVGSNNFCLIMGSCRAIEMSFIDPKV